MSAYSTSPPCTPLSQCVDLPDISPPSSIRSNSSCSTHSSTYRQCPSLNRQFHARYEDEMPDSGSELSLETLRISSTTETPDRRKQTRSTKPKPRSSPPSIKHHRRAYSLPQTSQGFLLIPRRSASPPTSIPHLPPTSQTQPTPPMPSRPQHTRHSSTASLTQGKKEGQGVMWMTPAMQAFMKKGGAAHVKGPDGRLYKVSVPSMRG